MKSLEELAEKVEEHERRITVLEKKTVGMEDQRMLKKKEVAKILLSPKDISTLKQKVERLGKIKGGRATLAIAEYLSKEKNCENFLPEDLAECYVILKKAGVRDIPPIRNMSQLVRDVYNKSKWFEKNPDGTYKISSLGYHKLSES